MSDRNRIESYEDCNFWFPKGWGPRVTSTLGIVFSLAFVLAQMTFVSRLQAVSGHSIRPRVRIHFLLFCFSLLNLVEYILRLTQFETLGIVCTRALALWALETAFVLFWNNWVQESLVSKRIKLFAKYATAISLTLYLSSTIASVWAAYTTHKIERLLLFTNYVVFAGPFFLVICIVFLIWTCSTWLRIGKRIKSSRQHSRVGGAEVMMAEEERETNYKQAKMLRKLSVIIAVCELCMVSRVVMRSIELASSEGEWNYCVMDDVLWELLDVHIPLFLRACIIMKFIHVQRKSTDSTTYNADTYGSEFEEFPVARESREVFRAPLLYPGDGFGGGLAIPSAMTRSSRPKKPRPGGTPDSPRPYFTSKLVPNSQPRSGLVPPNSKYVVVSGPGSIGGTSGGGSEAGPKSSSNPDEHGRGDPNILPRSLSGASGIGGEKRRSTIHMQPPIQLIDQPAIGSVSSNTTRSARPSLRASLDSQRSGIN